MTELHFGVKNKNLGRPFFSCKAINASVGRLHKGVCLSIARSKNASRQRLYYFSGLSECVHLIKSSPSSVSLRRTHLLGSSRASGCARFFSILSSHRLILNSAESISNSAVAFSSSIKGDVFFHSQHVQACGYIQRYP